MSDAQRVSVVLLGPALHAVSGVSTHLNQLRGSSLAGSFRFLHFQVGSEGRAPASLLRQAARFIFDPISFGFFVLRNKAQIVHINTSMEPRGYWRDTLYLLVARLLNRKVVYQTHGGALPEEFFSGRLSRALLRLVLRSADIVVLLAQIELRAYRAFAPQARLEVVANGIELKSLARSSTVSKAQGGLQLAYVGRLVASKGLFEALNAMAVLAKEGRKMQLTIAGGGPDEARLKSISNQLGLDGCVHFAGPLFGEAKDELWRAAHVFVFPTFHHEGLPYSLLEAMAAGAVPVTTRVGAIPDVLTDGVHGLLIDGSDPLELTAALRRLDDDRQSLAMMAKAGRSRVVKDYSVARLAEDFNRIYCALLTRS
jgi:glycosyltransferase involved in cell wall biosynthesis